MDIALQSPSTAPPSHEGEGPVTSHPKCVEPPISCCIDRPSSSKVETSIHDSTRELVTWECKEHGVKLRMC